MVITVSLVRFINKTHFTYFSCSSLLTIKANDKFQLSALPLCIVCIVLFEYSKRSTNERASNTLADKNADTDVWGMVAGQFLAFPPMKTFSSSQDSKTQEQIPFIRYSFTEGTRADLSYSFSIFRFLL